VPSALPDGQPAPTDGRLPVEALAGRADRPFGVYVHVPFCATRCGYCDFNTYTAKELGGGADQAGYADTVAREIALAAGILGDGPPAQTVFFGGGTPTLLPAADLVRTLAVVRDTLGLAADAEVSTEANPESVDEAYLAALREGGFNRVSFGMQSARPHVLAQLDRRHTPGRSAAVVAEARQAGFEHINLDLIYGTPGESDDDWRASLEAAVAAGPDHVSAYALIVEDGTRLAGQVRRGELPMPDDDVLADRYLIADELLSAAGLHWYEVSNWASSRPARCLHNELYWRGADWWGFGPGAHSHVGGVRWWNVKHPSAYASRLAEGVSPAAARELLVAEDRRIERVLLEIRLSDGLDPAVLTDAGRAAAAQLALDGLLVGTDRLVLTRRGRLLADAVVRALLPDE
jgi:putative oxygen-independent coproporphyrinogen III oxidase